MKNQDLKINFDLKATQGLNTESGSPVWQEGVVLRKVSKFVAGTPEDAIIPIPVFFDPKTGKMLEGMVPKDLRDEYVDYII